MASINQFSLEFGGMCVNEVGNRDVQLDVLRLLSSRVKHKTQVVSSAFPISITVKRGIPTASLNVCSRNWEHYQRLTYGTRVEYSKLARGDFT